jgi:hypothetical protein
MTHLEEANALGIVPYERSRIARPFHAYTLIEKVPQPSPLTWIPTYFSHKIRRGNTAIQIQIQDQIMVFSMVCVTALLFAFVSFSQGQVTNVSTEVEDLDRMGLRFLFNHGAATDAGNCTEADFTMLGDAIYSEIFSSNRPPKCKELCAGYSTGTCLVPDCKGYRRGGVEVESLGVLFF